MGKDGHLRPLPNHGGPTPIASAERKGMASCLTDGTVGVASGTATGQLRTRRIDAYDEGAEDILRLAKVTTFVLVPGA